MTNSEINICSIIIGEDVKFENIAKGLDCLLYTSPSPRD